MWVARLPSGGGGQRQGRGWSKAIKATADGSLRTASGAPQLNAPAHHSIAVRLAASHSTIAQRNAGPDCFNVPALRCTLQKTETAIGTRGQVPSTRPG